MAEFGKGGHVGIALVSGYCDHLVTRTLPFQHRDPLCNPDQGMEPEESANQRLESGDEIVLSPNMRALVAQESLELVVRQLVASDGRENYERAERSEHRRCLGKCRADNIDRS